MNVQCHLSKLATLEDDARAEYVEEIMQEFLMELSGRHDSIGASARRLLMIWSDVPLPTPSNKRPFRPFGL